MASVIRMPEVLANATEATIASWLVGVGDSVSVGLPIAEVETDKAVVEYAAELAGTLLQLLVAEGSTVAVGEPIAVVGAAGETVPGDLTDADEPAAEPASAPEPETAPEADPSPVADTPTELPSTGGSSRPAAVASAPQSAAAGRLFATPLVRRMAKENGVDLSALNGSGPGGRIIRRDLDAHLADAAVTGPAEPEISPPTARSGIEEVALTPMRRAIARRLVESKTTVPHYYLAADCEVEALLALRSQVNEHAPVKISVNDFVVKAVAAAYREVPEANVTWADTVIHRYSSVDIAIAVAVPNGLLTPVLRSVQDQSLTSISRSSAELAERARDGKLQQHELEGGVATVSNLGMYGVAAFSAIINPPQSLIIAVGAARQTPVVRAGELAVGTVMTVTISADHRVVDGALAAQWLAAFVRNVEQPVRMLV